ncbi:hypothetical protein ABZ470_01945 [Streptosporangium sp. NPDC020072]|uniref:hypothetical protein n=1 Tax=Streptosporangium sp. NPDC020072 TaxID=3154788 RepID=UPI00342DFA97
MNESASEPEEKGQVLWEVISISLAGAVLIFFLGLQRGFAFTMIGASVFFVSKWLGRRDGENG